MKIIYPYPMHLSNGYTYMLSISQFLNYLADYEDVSLFSLDSEKEFENYLSSVIDMNLNRKLKIFKITNKKFGIKSNRLFFSKNVYKKLLIEYDEKDIVFYTRDFKQMKEMLKYRSKFKNVKYIFEVHQILSQNYCREGNYKNAKEMKKLEEYVFDNVDGLISITNLLKNEINKIFNNPCPNHLVLPVGFSSKFLDLNNQSKKYNLIYSGNFSKWKGVDNLLYALKKVIKKEPLFNSVLIGANNKEFEYYNQRIKELKLTNNVKLYRKIPHKEILKFVEESEIGVLPNIYEGDALLFTSPLKLYEYLAAGLKVVCSRLPSIESAISEDFLYWSKADNIDSLADSILTAFKDRNFNLDKQRKFSLDFTWEKRAKKLSDFLKQL